MGSVASAAGSSIGSAFDVVGGIVGANAASGDRSKAEQAYNDSVNQVMGISAPPDLAKQILLQNLQQAGVLTPEMEQAINVGTSQVATLTDPSTGRDAQIQALQALQQVSKGGIRPEDAAAMNQIRQQVAQDTQSKQAQIMQNFQQRGGGVGGGMSGAELAAQLQAGQSGANQEANQGNQLAAQASQRALAAMGQAGQAGQQLNAQDFQQALTKAQAADAFKQFDLQNQMAQQSRNVAAQNQAQGYNLQNAQNISNANAQMANQEKQRQLAGAQQNWSDQFALAQAKSGAQANLSNYYGQLGNNVAKNTSDMYSGIGNFAGGALKDMGSGGGGSSSSGSGGQQVAGGGDDIMGMASAFAAHGGKVPGTPIVNSDSEINDVKPYMLSPDEVILPASIAKSDKLHEVYTFLRNLETHKGKK